MSYRTSINNFQIFGNNEYYQEWIDFLVSQGIEVNEEGCYDGYITDFMGMIRTIEKIVLKRESVHQENRIKFLRKAGDKPYNEIADKLTDQASIFDFSSYIHDFIINKQSDNLLDYSMQLIKNAYLFMPYQAYLACKDVLEKCKPDDDDRLRFYNYKVKDGCSIRVHAG